ncbi:TrmB family transcriptional regulator [Patescibacteria group bacterium]
MEITRALQEIGLSEKEADIYTTLLQLGEGSILDIAKNSTLKRPTIYSGIEALEGKGLVTRVPVGKRIKFRPEEPTALETLLRQKERKLETLLPQLAAITNVPRGTKPEIRFYEGKESVAALYRSLFAQLDEKDTINFITSMRDLFVSFPEILGLLDELAIKHQWKIREIIPQSAAAERYLSETERSAQKNPRHKVRLLPKGMDLFDVDIAVTKKAILFISLQKDIFGITIQSPHFIQSFQSIHKALWMVSEEPK